MRKLQRARAFSLPELLIAVLLLAGLLLVGFLRHGSERGRAGSEGLAQRLVAELRAARAQAMATGSPVAVAWPQDGGPHSRSVFRLEGRARGRITAVQDFQSIFPDAVMAIGSWGSAVTTTGGPSTVSAAAWLPDGFDDYAVIFTPEGTITSNDLALSDGGYKVLVGSSVEFSSAAPPAGARSMATPPPYFTLTGVSAPHTITLRPSGEIFLEDGAPGLRISAHPVPMSPAAPAESVTTTTARDPVLRPLEVFPRPVSGEPATVTRGGTLNIRVTAASDDDLFVEWFAVPRIGTSGPGYFSQKEKAPMTWDPETDLWRADVSWVPASAAVIGDTYDIHCEVTNAAGASVSGTSAELSEVGVVNDDEFVINDDAGIYSLRAAGGGAVKKLMDLSWPFYVSLSPDGSKICWRDYHTDRYWVANADGSDPQRLNAVDGDVQPCWNRTGTRLYYGTDSGLMSIRPDGSAAPQLVRDGLISGLRASLVISVSSDSRYLAMVGAVLSDPADPLSPAPFGLYIAELDDSADPPEVSDWTYLPLPPGYRTSGSSVVLRFHPQPADPSRPVVLLRLYDAASFLGLHTVGIQDRGTGNSPRFTADYQPLRLPDNRLADLMGVTFNRDGTRLGAVDWSPSPHLTTYTWDTSSGVPRLTGPETIDVDGHHFRHLDWR